MILRRLILFFTPIVWIAGIEVTKVQPALGLWIGIGLLFYLFLAVLIFKKYKIDRSFFHFITLPLLFGLSSFSFTAFLTSPNTILAVSILSAACLYLIFRQYYLYFNFPFRYQPYSLESLSLYLSLITGFFLFASFFGADSLFHLKFYFLMGGLLLLTGLLIYQFFWIHKIPLGKSRLFIFSIALILAELFFAITYLPTGFYVNSFLLTVCLYLMLGFSKHFLTNTLTKRRVIIYSVLAIVSIAVVLFTAQWS